MSYTNGLDKPSDYFNTVLYTGNSSTQSITGVGFQPDWIWVKSRSGAFNHEVIDVVRGGGVGVFPNLTIAESSGRSLSAFTSDGFTLSGSDTTSNNNGSTYASWNWLAGGTASSNTDGSITSNVSTSTTSGFSIVSYTGTGSGSETIGHGLGVKPKAVLIKSRSLSKNWIYWQDTNGDGSGETRLALNLTSGDFANYPVTFNTNTITLPSLSDDAWSTSSATYIAYCFAEKKGFSKFGSYTGNGSADGTFIYTGFKPAFTIIKQSSGAGERWVMDDAKRSSFNEMNNTLFADSSGAEYTAGAYGIDFLSNGIKLKTSHVNYNQSGQTYIYMCFAENPFVTSTSIPCTAR